MRQVVLPSCVFACLAAACLAEPTTQPATLPAGIKTFPTAELAVEAFANATRTGDTVALAGLLGPDGTDILVSGDPTADRNAREAFTTAYDERHELSATSDGASVTVLLGQNRWPLPIPVVRVEGGYRFDAAAGRDEILNRRIGRNELDAIKVMHAIADAQQDYVRLDPDHDGVPAYADRFASSPGRHDGLYWPTKPGEGDSPLGPLIDQAADEGYADPATQPTTAPAVSPRTPYHGYYYRILTRQGAAAPGGAMDYRVNGSLLGGFAVIAWPADYGSSGVMIFLISHRGVVYQRDLGEQTAAQAAFISAFDPTDAWTPAEPPANAASTIRP